MITLAEVEFKYEIAKQDLAFTIKTRDDLQEVADRVSDQKMKDIIVVGILELNTSIEEMTRLIREIEANIADYKRRIYNLHQQ